MAEQGPDDIVRAVGRAIEAQAGASADQMDLLLWGLMARHTAPTITAQDWKDSAPSAERRSMEQARHIEAETAQIQAVAGSIFESAKAALGLMGTGTFGLMVAWILKNQSTIKGLVGYARDMEKAETDDDVKHVKAKHARAHKVVAKVEASSKVP